MVGGYCGHLSGLLDTQLGWLCLLAVLAHPLHPPHSSPTHPLIYSTRDIAGYFQSISPNQPVQPIATYIHMLV